MVTNCRFILENASFDFIDDELIEENIQCMFPYYNHGDGCSSCPVFRQLFETKTKNNFIEENEDIQKEIQLWWV